MRTVYPTVPHSTVYKMSSYNPPHRRQQQYWNSRDAQREAERRAAEEEQRRKTVMNETNYPTLTAARPMNQRDALPGRQFAKLAEQWAVDAEVDRRLQDYRKLQEAVERTNAERIANRHAQHTREARHDEYYEEELASEPVSRSVLDDDAGWTEVKRKTRKPRRELTDEEMLAMDHKQEETEEFNSHLFDSNRHDHDRV
jgi:hypothetical protein